MGKRCFVPGCNTGYESTVKKLKAAGQRMPSVFRVPKDSVKKWAVAIRRKDRMISEDDYVCELHFTEDSIERFFETKLPDGSVFKLERVHAALKKDAVPTVFPHLPSYVSSKTKKRKRTTKSVSVPKKIEHDYSLENLIEHEPEDFNFSSLIENIDKVEKPSKWWCFNVVENYVACVLWDRDYQITKKIIIDSDLNVKIFLKDEKINGITGVCSLAAVATLLQMVDGMKMC